MGLLSSLLPGLRDLRTPPTSGYVWLLALWLLLSDNDAVSAVVTSLTAQLDPVAALLGDAAAVTAVTFVAYLLGSLFVVDAARERGVTRVGAWLWRTRRYRLSIPLAVWAVGPTRRQEQQDAGGEAAIQAPGGIAASVHVHALSAAPAATASP